MTFVPHFVQNELDVNDFELAKRLSAFNFSDPFDYILPFTDGAISAADRAHLWGLYSGIAANPTLTTNLISAFNWCNPFDHILPIADNSVTNLDRAHLWGMYSGIAPGGAAAVIKQRIRGFTRNVGRL